MSGFTKTLVAGAVAAAALPGAVALLGPALGGAGALGLHVVLANAGWLAWLARGARQRLAVFGATAAAGGAAWAVVASVPSLVVVLGVLVAVTRSGLLYRRRPGRAWALEAALGGAACGVAAFLHGPGLAAAALAVWGWFVVQSFYFLVGGLARRPRPARGDAFETAARRLETLLDPAA